MVRQKGPVTLRTGTHRSIAGIESRASSAGLSTVRRSKPSDNARVKGEDLMTLLVAGASFRYQAPMVCCLARAGYLRELLALLRGVPRFKPHLFQLAPALALSAQLDRVSDEFVEAVDPSYRIDR
jgi:hypothetical protein